MGITYQSPSGSGTVLQGAACDDMLRPRPLQASINDYAPFGHELVSSLELAPLNDVSLTGLAGGIDGRTVSILSRGPGVLTLPAEDVGSAAVNRFATALSIAANAAAVLRWTRSISRWVTIASSASAAGAASSIAGALSFMDDFLSVGVGATGSSAWNAAVTGAAATVDQQAGTVGRPGMVALSTGTTAAGDAGILLGYNSAAVVRSILPSADAITLNAMVRVPDLPAAAQDFQTWIGLADRLALGNQRALARVNFNGAAALWSVETGDGVGTTQTAAAFGPVANTWHHVRLVITSTLVQLFVDGVLAASSSTNLGLAGYTPIMRILKSVGITSRQFHCDLVTVAQTFTARFT